MQASIEGEDDDGCGLEVLDNNGVEHWIEIKYESGEISYHEQDGYPDDAEKRTSEGNEHVNQVRRYARYYVFAEQRYDTIDHAENPAYIDAVRRAIADLPEADFERYFGALYRQLRSHQDDTDRPRELPADVRNPDAVVYEPEIYLGLEVLGEDITDRAQALANAHGLAVSEEAQVRPTTDLSEDTVERWEEFSDDLEDIVAREDIETELTVTGVSGLHIGYPDSRGQHEVDEADTPFTYQPQARLSLLPYAPDSIEGFREFLDHHLRCQIRDCFLKMGVVPTEPYQLIGFGNFRDARRYDHFEMYPQVHKPDGDHTPLLG